MRKYIILFLLTTILNPALHARGSKLYSSGDLTCNLINSIYQDVDGFVWVATEYGLNKFNGSGFIQYLNDEKDTTSLLGNYVRSLFIDKNNTFWIGCNNGLQYYVPAENNFRTIPVYNGFKPHINAMAE
jgi:ligand-binding sensor domain-containing protein